MIVGFIDTQRCHGHAVESVCAVLTSQGCQVAARSYRRWHCRTTTASAARVCQRAWDEAALMNAIHSIAYRLDEASGTYRLAPEGLYGRRKMQAALARTGVRASYGRVHSAMAALCLNGVRRGKPVRTTIANKDGVRAGDLLNRDFTADAPDTKWVADFTYVRTWAGFVYVAFILDCFSQRIVAWHAATSKATALVMTPLRMALWDRDRNGHPVTAGQLISHSDAGSQYTSLVFTDHLSLEGIAASIGTVGDAFDNSLMETTVGLYKTECIRTRIFHDGPYKTITDVEYATAGWVSWYNTTRLHSSIGMVPPAEYEQTYYLNKAMQDTPV
jgi:transposase InsO family protein